MKIELRATSHMIYNSKIYKFVEFHDGAISVTIVTIFRTFHTDYFSPAWLWGNHLAFRYLPHGCGSAKNGILFRR